MNLQIGYKMELRHYLQKYDCVLYYIDNRASLVAGFPLRTLSTQKEISDIVPFVSPNTIEFKFGSHYDYYGVINTSEKSIIDRDELFYDFIDRIRDGLI